MRKTNTISVSELYSGFPGIKHESLTLNTLGVVEDKKHYGPVMQSGPRKRQGNVENVAQGEMDMNWRQFSMISNAEIKHIRHQYEAHYNSEFNDFDARFFGANIIVDGILNTATLPNGTVIEFSSGPLLVVFSETTACKNPGIKIAEYYGLPIEEARIFRAFSKRSRGCCGMVLVPGSLKKGSTADIYIPN